MRTYTVDEILPIYQKAALIVERYGDRYLPVFLRAEEMLEQARKNQSATQRARMVAAELSRN